MPPVLAAGISLLTALAGWGAGALTPSGAAAATAVGTAILASTGWPGAAVLGTFFLPSAVVSRRTASRSGGSDAQVERRGARQVFSNGGAAALGALAEWRAPGLGIWMVTTSLAAAAGDTWATSIGALSRAEPRLLLGGRPVPRGTSGAVSIEGTLGAGAGAALVAAAGAAATRAPILMWSAAIGALGMLLDSLLGASLQAGFECPVCGGASERRRHLCGASTRLVKGWRWLDNDAVNALTTTCAALAGGAAWRLAST